MKHLCVACALLASIINTADARGRLICGFVMRQLTGGRYGPEYNLARHWAHLPRTAAHPGAVVVQSRKGKDTAGHPGGHVSIIREVRGDCRALVSDDKGTYVRDICRNLIGYVQP